MSEQVSDREILRELAARPIGGEGARCWQKAPHVWDANDEAREAAKRAGKTWLPAGKRSASSKEEREYRKAFREQQIDLEDAVEQAGGQRGHMAA